MKKLILSLGIIMLIVSCSNNDIQTENNQPNSIIGTWNMIGVFEDYGQANPQWENFADGFDYTFNVDGTFESNRYNCDNGTYTLVNDNYLTVNLNCSGNQIEIPYSYTLDNDDILIMTLDSMDCNEGCPNEKFERIN